MTNLFPLPYWAPALKRVPLPLQALDEAFLKGGRAARAFRGRRAPQTACSAPLAAPLSVKEEDVSRSPPG